MSNLNATALWQTLVNHQLVNTNTTPETTLASPWYIIAMQIIGGWVAALFLLACVLVSGSIIGDIDQSFIGLGAALSLSCLVYYRLGANRQEFILQMVFAFSLSGQIMWLLGVYEWLESSHETLTALIYLVTFMIHWIIIPHKTNQFVAALAMVPSFLAILVVNQVTLLILPLLLLSLVVIWSHVYRWPQYYQRLRMLGYAIAINLLLANFMLSDMGDIIERPSVLMAFNSSISDYLAITISLLTTLWLVNHIVNLLHSTTDNNTNQVVTVRPRNKLMVILAAILIGLLSIVMSGLSVAVLMLLLGYFYNERKLVIISVCALLAFIGMYYYSLHIDLFDKSLWLMASGIVLLMLRFAISKNASGKRKNKPNNITENAAEMGAMVESTQVPRPLNKEQA